jgi:glycosyltransferase involved in cell wall biosynthesis
MSDPEVSVVMAVFNGAPALRATMDSVLAERAVKLELIVVDDGSTDETSAILRGYAEQDSRVCVLTEQHHGLTRALIKGCEHACGEFVARQDCGDVTFRGRFHHQVHFLRSNPDVVLTSCGTRFVGPEGEFLYDTRQVGAELHDGLTQLDPNRVRSVSSHTSAMFRRSSYEAVGGYRSEFRVAQDLDLWMRFAEIGQCLATPEVFCERRLALGSISASHRQDQVKTTKTIVACAAARRRGGDEGPVLEAWRSRQAGARSRTWRLRTLSHARFYYFLASVLRHHNPARARYYYFKALRYWLLFPRAYFGLIRLALRSGLNYSASQPE